MTENEDSAALLDATTQDENPQIDDELVTPATFERPDEGSKLYRIITHTGILYTKLQLFLNHLITTTRSIIHQSAREPIGDGGGIK